jgi:hypothetical protein
VWSQDRRLCLQGWLRFQLRGQQCPVRPTEQLPAAASAHPLLRRKRSLGPDCQLGLPAGLRPEKWSQGRNLMKFKYKFKLKLNYNSNKNSKTKNGKGKWSNSIKFKFKY